MSGSGLGINGYYKYGFHFSILTTLMWNQYFGFVFENYVNSCYWFYKHWALKAIK